MRPHGIQIKKQLFHPIESFEIIKIKKISPNDSSKPPPLSKSVKRRKYSQRLCFRHGKYPSKGFMIC